MTWYWMLDDLYKVFNNNLVVSNKEIDFNFLLKKKNFTEWVNLFNIFNILYLNEMYIQIEKKKCKYLNTNKYFTWDYYSDSTQIHILFKI